MIKEIKRTLSVVFVLLIFMVILFGSDFFNVYAGTSDMIDKPDNERFEAILDWQYKELQSTEGPGLGMLRTAKQVSETNVAKGEYWWYGTGYAKGKSGTVYQGWLTREFYVDGRLAYCLEPDQGTVPNGKCSAYVNTGLSAELPRVIKGMYYLYGGPGYDKYRSAYGDLSALNIYAGAESVDEGYPQSDTARRFTVTHVALSVMFDQDNGVNSENRNTYKGLTAMERAVIDKVVANVTVMPDIVIDPELSFSCRSLTGKWDNSRQAFKTETVKLNGRAESKVTIPLGEGMTLVNETTGAKGTGNVQVKGGDSFYIISVAGLSGQAYESGTLNSNAVNTFTALVIDSSGSDEQAVGSWTYRSLTPSAVSLSVSNEVIGKIKIRKTSTAPQITDSSSYYSLSGAVYGLYHAQSGAKADQITLDKDGTGAFDYVVCGDYYIQEIEPPEGYITNPAKYEVKSGDFGTDIEIVRQVTDQPQYGRIILKKIDAESGKPQPQGAGMIAGAVYEIKDAAGAAAGTLTVDGEGKAVSGMLPLGKYTISEVAASEGYLLDKTIYTVDIKSDDRKTEIFSKTLTSKEQVKRGDLELIKVSRGDMRRLAGVTFSVTSMTTGESLVIVTDENGYATTADPDNRMGTLPYDTYEIEELRGEANAEYDLIPPFNIVISRDSYTVNLGTLINEYTEVYLNTSAQNESTGVRMAFPQEQVTIVDMVEYSNLVKGKEYTVKGTLIDKETGKPLLVGGKEVTGRQLFTAEEPNGSVNVALTFNAGSLAGRSVVVFERLYSGSRLAASHEDIHAEGQTIRFLDPVIGTRARSAETDINQSFAGPETAIIDIVEYSNLVAGKEYTVRGILMNAEDGNPLQVNGEEVTAEKTFTAEAANGSIELEFYFDASMLTGEMVVIFENLYYQGDLIAAHADIEDKGQTIRFPDHQIRTAARDAEIGGSQSFAKKEVTVIDMVEYKNLIPGQEYTLKGTLMDKQTGERLLAGDQEIISEKTFIADEPDGVIELSFTFDAGDLAGSTIVVFEALYHNELEVAVHADLEDRAQTIDIPDIEIKTTARDAKTGENETYADETVTIIDTVTYKYLIVGQEYTVKGVIMDKESGEPLLVNGEQIQAEAIFTADAESGSVDLAFTFNAGGQAGKKVVVFEYLYHNGEEIAAHADLEDAKQTVHIIEIQKEGPKGVPQTGDTLVPGALIAALAVSALILAAVIKRKYIPWKRK